VFNAALKLLQYPLPYEFIAYVDGHKNPIYLDLVNNVASNVFNAAVGDITILTNRTKAVDFTQPYIESDLVVVVRIDKPDSINIPKSRLVALGSPDKYAEKLLSGTVAAIVDERPYMDFFLSKHCDFQIVGKEFTTSGMGFAFPRDSPLAVDMSTAILRLTETGEFKKIHDNWINKEACGPQSSSLVSDQVQLKSF
ncbi:glutamate receptor 3.2-like protein, partial [Tanacetum coccineum]